VKDNQILSFILGCNITLNYNKAFEEELCMNKFEDKFENKFVLKPIMKSLDDDFVNGLAIYMKETPKEILTNSNEITYWLDKGTTDNPFEMMLFVLYLDNVLIGFSQITYIKSQQIVILDYISIKEPYRVNSVFLVFLSMIQNYLISSGKQIIYYIAEISNKDAGKNIDRESAFYKRIICLENYGQVMNKYYNLPLGIDNYESEFESLMYIKTNDNIPYINRETFLAIVKSICYEYYYSWYSEFLDDKNIQLYKNKLDNYYDEIKKTCTSVHIEIKYSQCPLFYQENTNKTFGSVPAQKKRNYAKIPLLAISVIILPIVLALFYSTLLPYLNIQFGNISTFISGLLGTCATSYIAFRFGNKK